MIVLLGEVGGVEEYDVCEALKDGRIDKPLVAWCIGTCAGLLCLHHFKIKLKVSHWLIFQGHSAGLHPPPPGDDILHNIAKNKSAVASQ
jgi:succinyl-CoA synthetase alpha subunit